MRRRGLVILLVAIILLLLVVMWWINRKKKDAPLPEFGEYGPGGEDLVQPLPVVDQGQVELLDNGLMELLPGLPLEQPVDKGIAATAGKAIARTDEPSGSPDWVVV
jgi:hypothetical protein